MIMRGAYFFIFILFFYSCATIIEGPSQKVNINSEPLGAKVFIDSKFSGLLTPCIISLKRKINSPTIRLEKEGFESLNYTFEKKRTTLSYLDESLSGCFGFVFLPITLIAGANQSTSSYLTMNFAMIALASPYPVDLISGSNTGYKRPNTFVLNNNSSNRQMPLGNENNNIENSNSVANRFSDVDFPQQQKIEFDENKVALIIGNEDYTDMSNVKFARNDASIFRNYCVGLLGIRYSNIVYVENGTLTKLNQGIDQLNKMILSKKGNAKVVVYYAGHGLPNEETKEPYILPVDVSGANFEVASIKLSDFYKKVTENSSKQVTVFIDACFSGGGKDAGLIASRGGIKAKLKLDYVKGNFVVFNACKDDQSALPYEEQHHGMFTYFVLKKIMNEKGSIELGELANYLKDKVSTESLNRNSKKQEPQILFGEDAKVIWEHTKL